MFVFLRCILQSVTGVAPSPEWAKATTEQISRDRHGRWEGRREIVCVSVREKEAKEGSEDGGSRMQSCAPRFC